MENKKPTLQCLLITSVVKCFYEIYGIVYIQRGNTTIKIHSQKTYQNICKDICLCLDDIEIYVDKNFDKKKPYVRLTCNNAEHVIYECSASAYSSLSSVFHIIDSVTRSRENNDTMHISVIYDYLMKAIFHNTEKPNP